MSKALYEKLAKLHAGLSDAFEELAALAPGKAGKAAAAADDADADDDLPPAKTAGTKGKPAAKKAKAAPEPEPDADDADADGDGDEDGPTEDDVVAAAQALIKATGSKDKALAIIKKHGGKRVADLESDVYAEVISDFKKAMPKKGKPAADDTDDI